MRAIFQLKRQPPLAATALLAACLTTPAWAAGTVDDFESYSLGSFSSSNWTVVDPVTVGSPTVRNDSGGILGNYLQFDSKWSPDAFDTIEMKLPYSLVDDGDYLQLAVNVASGTAMASMFMQPGPFLANTSRPWAAVGLDTQFNQFNTGYNTVHEDGSRFGSAGANQWYYLRATVRDNGGEAGVIDSYDFQIYSDSAGANLIDQKTSIPFRNGYEGFISHIALRSFEQNDLSATVRFDQITTNRTSAAPQPVRPADFGTQWVRSHPFDIVARAAGDAAEPLVQQLHLTGVEARSGANTDAAARAGMIWNANPSMVLYDGVDADGPLPLTDALKRTISDFVVQGGMHGAIQLDDEPKVEVMNDLGVIANWIRQTYPQLMIFTTAGWGPTEQYIDNMMTTIHPDVLMYDIYPVLKNQPFDLDEHFKYLTLVRNKGKQYGVPAYAWLQSFSDDVRRMPSDSELRLLAYSYMAAGYKGLGYFRFNSNSQQGLLDANGQPDPLFAKAAGLNTEIRNLGQTLRFLDSTDIRYIPALFGHQPDDLAAWSPNAGGDSHLLGIGGVGFGNDGMIGFFTDDAGRQYFMLVNLLQGMNLDADQTAASFAIQFDSTVDRLWRMDRQTGQVEMILLEDNQLNWTLPGGTGDLFSYQPVFVPEPSFIGLLTISLLSLNRRTRMKTHRR